MTKDDALALLVNMFGYDEEWLRRRSKGLTLVADGQPLRAPGVILQTDRNQAFLVLALSDGRSPYELEALVKSMLEKDPFVEIGGWTDGTANRTSFLRLRRRTGGFEQVSGPALAVNQSRAHGVIHYVTAPTSGKSTSVLRPVDETFGRILFEAHSALRDVDGLHPDEALDELCKLIYAKLYDEERADAQKDALRFQLFPYISADELATAIRHLYAEACQYDTRVFGLKIAGYQRSRGVFAEPLHLSGAAIHQLVRIFQPLAFLEADVDVKGRAFQKVLGPTFRGGLGQYFTPAPIIDFLVSAVAPTVDDLVLDPFCGSGHFLASALEHVRGNTKGARATLIHEFAFGKLHGIEVSARMVRVAMTDMRLQGDGHSNIRCADALLPFSTYGDLAPETFDVVLTNPPFGSLLGREALARLDVFELARNGSTPLELLGLERSIQFLRPGGRLGIVLPESILTNRKAEFVRDWLHAQVKVRAIVGLPHLTFAALGANIKTCIVVGRKWNSGEVRDPDLPVWVAELDDIGIDATGKATRNSDIPKASMEFSSFIDKHGW